MTFNQIKTRIKEFCGLTSTDADTRIGIAINQHYRRVTASLGMDPVRFVTRSATTTEGVATVTFSEIEKIDRIIDATTATSIRPLTEKSIDYIRTTQPGTGAPSVWALQNTDADSVTVRLDVVPATGSSYSLQADGTTTLGDMSGSDEPVFSESFHDILSFLVIAEELLRKEKIQLAREFASGDEERPGRAETAIRDLRFKIADSPSLLVRQGSGPQGGATSGGSGGGGNQGGTSYTQSGLLTFDRGPGVAPFAVAQADAPYVANLGAEFLGNIATDRLTGRDTAGTGETEQLTVGGGVEFTGSGGIQRSALTGDVTAPAGSNTTTIANDAVETAMIADDQVTYAKMQNISAASRMLGRGSAGGAGDPQELSAGVGLEVLSTTLNVILPSICDGRLTLTSGTPVTTSDVTGATTIYFTPHAGNKVALFDGTNWALYTFTERSLALGTLTSGLPYDVFLYNNSGTLTLELTAWTNTTTRATALTKQDGVYVKTGATTRRYLGTLHTTSTTQTEDSVTKRLLWNYYHRAPRLLQKLIATDSYTYTTATVRQWEGSTANQVEIVVGVAEDVFQLDALHTSSNSSADITRRIGIGEGSTTTILAACLRNECPPVFPANQYFTHPVSLRKVPAAGYQFYAGLEVSQASGTTTWVGDGGSASATQSGLTGWVRG